MKAIMISIKPRWCAKIMNGEKTIEVRKNKALANAIQKLIDENGYADIYVHCSKDKKYANLVYRGGFITGMVAFKFRCYKVVPIVMQMGAPYGYGNNGYVGYGHCEKDNFKFMYEMEEETCLDEDNDELCKYLNNGKKFSDIYINKLKANDGYAIHISDLEIFDRPKELSEFYKASAWKVYEEQFDSSYMKRTKQEIMKSLNQTITKAPQNFCYVEVE